MNLGDRAKLVHHRAKIVEDLDFDAIIDDLLEVEVIDTECLDIIRAEVIARVTIQSPF